MLRKMGELAYWRKGEESQNFGDYLNEYLAGHLFLSPARDATQIRLIGSFLGDQIIEEAEKTAHEVGGGRLGSRFLAWGGGIRETGGVSARNRAKVEILSVRGPLSASELQLDATTPQGDPAFLLPALHSPRMQPHYRDKTLCIPHFNDRRSDAELLAISKADLVLRPGIEATDEAVESFIDALCSARFVLSASLHGAIVAAAYGRPFAPWNPDFVDLPAKWQDFAQGVGIPATFVANVEEGIQHYAAQIAPKLRRPSLWEALARAPYVPSPEAILKILRHELRAADGRPADAVLQEKIALFEASRSHFAAIAQESRTLVDAAWQREDAAQARIAEHGAGLEKLQAQVETLLSQIEAARAHATQSDAHLAEREETIARLRKQADAQSKQSDAARERATRLGIRVEELQREVDMARHQVGAVQAAFEEMRRSSSWRLTRPLRALADLLKIPLRAIGRTGLLFRAMLGLLLLLPASVYCGGFGAVFRAYRRTPAFAATVFDAHQEIRQRLMTKPRWWRRIVMLSYTLAHRVYLAGSVGRVVGSALRMLRSEGLSGLRASLARTGPGGGPDGFERRILVLDYRIPRGDTSAGELATVGILRDLVALGYEVVFAPNDMTPSPRYEKELESFGVTVITRQAGFQYTGHYIERHGASFGVFYVMRFDVAENALPSIRKTAPHARVIFHAPDLYFLREMREARLLDDPAAVARAEATRQREVAMMRAADHVVLVSPAEVPFLREELGAEKPITVFPVLYAPVAPRPAGFAARRDIFFLGGFGHAPNVSAVQWFAKEIWPAVRTALPEVEFHVVGAEVPESIQALEAIPGIKIRGFVPDLEPVLQGYRVGVAPLLFGAGIKGKVAMTLGAGIPCVGTRIAAEGMGIQSGVHSIIEDEPDKFAAAVVALYQDEALWQRLSRNGQALVEERFGEVANRSALLRVLNDARGLPLSLFRSFCAQDRPFAVPQPPADVSVDVSIIVPVYNKWALTRACLASIAYTNAGVGISYEVILADDSSSDETLRAQELVPGLRIARTPQNMGFLRNCNHAAKLARGRHILLLNNDTVVLPGWLDAMHRTLEGDDSIAIVGSKLLYPNGRIQEAGGGMLANADGVSIGRWLYRQGLPMPVPRDEPVFNFERETDYLTGASILIRGSFWRATGGFDERFGNAYCEDSDLAMQARARGLRVVYQPASELVHLEHQSYADEVDADHIELQRRNKAVLVEKWHDVLLRDHLPAGAQWQQVAARGERSIPPAVQARRAASESRNILYFSPFPSHPSNHGNQATIQQFARQFQRSGHKVHFALLQSNMYDLEAEQSMRAEWDSFDILPNAHPLGADGSAIPFDGWYEDGLGEAVRALCARYDIDVVFCSYVFQSKMLDYIPSYILRVIDTHDKMGGRYEMLQQRGLPLEFFSCTPEEEGAYLRRADVVVARRQEEADYFDSVSGAGSAIVVPHFEAPHFVRRAFTDLRQVGIVASANRINLEIVRDCLQSIDRQVGTGHCPFLVLVAGQVKALIPTLPAHEAALFDRPWVRLLGFVEDIQEFYESVDVVISPVTMGTGINVKTVQAIAYGMPLLTTEWGSKGVDTSEPLHKLASLDDLVRTLLQLVERPAELERLAAVSRGLYQQFFDTSVTALQALVQRVPMSAAGHAAAFQDGAPRGDTI